MALVLEISILILTVISNFNYFHAGSFFPKSGSNYRREDELNQVAQITLLLKYQTNQQDS